MKPAAKISPVLFIRPAFLLVLALVLHILGYFPKAVENWYSTGIYKGISATLRLLTKWAPFSIGDCLYILFIISIIVALVRALIRLKREGWNRWVLIPMGLHLFSKILWIYIVFRLLWGLNYNRLGIEYQLKLSKKGYQTEDVIQLSNRLIDSLNACRQRLPDTLLPAPPLDSIFRMAGIGYARAWEEYSFLNYTQRSIKPSLFTGLADWMGFTGYYNPFTGEAQVRTDVPKLVLPFVACHEIAHQLGYASESEANMVGLLAALASGDPFFRYSAYNDLFSYAQREELYLLAMDKDSLRFQQVIQLNRERMDTLVRKDRKEVREFFQQRQHKTSATLNNLYDQYLRFNNQEAGVKSYDEVIGWLIAYLKKYEQN
ncbi:DUF3810 domain-containing protein [Sediminibacterium sp.]|uniref:DUF3810 domain-containing protein n=1 Tax=Sediminibacterium sp. TaxID=1917865 RepID=UPI0025CC71B3|nr:DUF3810 domain-containing protein [Sediminibacterium sp.]MBW0178159.1 DUF3810 domain-containing protein [Sediminibacterium sp.]